MVFVGHLAEVNSVLEDSNVTTAKVNTLVPVF